MSANTGGLVLRFGVDMADAQAKLSDLAKNVAKNMSTIGSLASIAAKALQSDIGQGASDAAAKLTKVSTAASTVVRGFIAFEVAKVVVSSLISTIDEMADHVVELTKISDKASGAGVGTTFLQAWLGQAKALRIEVSDLERMLTNAQSASEVHLGEGKYGDGAARTSTSAFAQRLEQHVAAGNIGDTDSKAFASAEGMEAKIRVVLDLLSKLDSEGKKLAEYDLAGKMFGPQFESQLRSGTDMVGKMRDALNGVQRGLADRIIPEEEIRRGQELNDKLAAAKSLMAEGLAPIMNDIARSSLEVYGDWVDVVGQLAKAAKHAGELYQSIKGISGEVDRRISNGLKSIGLTPGTMLGNVLVGMGLVQTDGVETEERPLTVRRRKAPDTSRNLPNLHERSHGDSSSEAKAALDSYIESLSKSVAVARAELETIGKSNIEKARAVDLVRAEEAARKDFDDGKRTSATLTDAERAKVLALADAEGRLKDQTEQTNKAIAERKAMGDYFGNMGESAVEKLIVDHKGLRDILSDIVKELERAAIKWALLGNGFGGSGGGGLFGSLLGGSKGSSGGGLSSLFGMLGGGSTSASNGLADLIGFNPFAYANGGAVGTGVRAGFVPASAFIGAPRFADGGGIPAILHAGEIVLNAAQQRNVAGSMSGGKPTINQHFNLNGTISGSDVDMMVRQGAAAAITHYDSALSSRISDKQARSY